MAKTLGTAFLASVVFCSSFLLLASRASADLSYATYADAEAGNMQIYCFGLVGAPGSSSEATSCSQGGADSAVHVNMATGFDSATATANASNSSDSNGNFDDGITIFGTAPKRQLTWTDSDIQASGAFELEMAITNVAGTELSASCELGYIPPVYGYRNVRRSLPTTRQQPQRLHYP
jgi:hypothetical protein